MDIPYDYRINDLVKCFNSHSIGSFAKKNRPTHARSIRHSMAHLSRRGTSEPIWKLLKSVVFMRPILLGLREQSRYTWFANRCFKKDEANLF